MTELQPQVPSTDLKAAGVSISVHGLGKRFNREWIFRNLSFEFHPGQTYALTGPNGSGKSTLLQVLWGQMPPSVGAIEYQDSSKEIPAEEIFKRLSIATPYMDLIDEFTLEEQIRFHFRIRVSRNNMTIGDLLDRMYLAHAAGKFIGNFSSGMRQRVKLALAFFTQADIIFLDEPGTNLDHQAFEWYLSELKQLPTNATVFIASNQPAEYPHTAQKIDIMQYK